MDFATTCLHGGYEPQNGEPSALPIYQSTTFKYDSTAEVAKLFDLQAEGFFYSRLANPTVDAVEQLSVPALAKLRASLPCSISAKVAIISLLAPTSMVAQLTF